MKKIYLNERIELIKNCESLERELSGVWDDVPEMIIPAHTEKLY